MRLISFYMSTIFLFLIKHALPPCSKNDRMMTHPLTDPSGEEHRTRFRWLPIQVSVELRSSSKIFRYGELQRSDYMQGELGTFLEQLIEWRRLLFFQFITRIRFLIKHAFLLHGNHDWIVTQSLTGHAREECSERFRWFSFWSALNSAKGQKLLLK